MAYFFISKPHSKDIDSLQVLQVVVPQVTPFMEKKHVTSIRKSYAFCSRKCLFRENHTFKHIRYFVQKLTYGATYNWFTNLFNDVDNLPSMEITFNIDHWVTSIHPTTIVKYITNKLLRKLCPPIPHPRYHSNSYPDETKMEHNI